MKQKLVDVQHTLATVTQDLAHIVQRINGCVSLLESVIREHSDHKNGPAWWARTQDLEEVVQRQDDTIKRLAMIVERHTKELSLPAFVPQHKPKAKKAERKKSR